MVYSIGEVAKMLRVSPEALRIWEKQGFIPKPQRRPTGMREYTSNDIEAIRQYLNQKNQTQSRKGG